MLFFGIFVALFFFFLFFLGRFFAFWFAFFFGCFFVLHFSHFFTNKLIFKFIGSWLTGCHKSVACVWNIWRDVKLLLLDFFPFEYFCPFLLHVFDNKGYFQQGHTASLTYRVQQSYGLGWDITADHRDVPATLFPWWEEAQPKNLHVIILQICNFRCTVVAIC